MENSGKLSGSWYRIRNEEDIPSPALLVYPERIEENILRMIRISGSSDTLRPHVKTHKMSEIVKLQLKHGIQKFKCATIAEAEMTAHAGAKDIMLAYQPVGPSIERFLALGEKFRKAQFSCITDNESIIQQLSDAAVKRNTVIPLWLDINAGMNRTGVNPDKYAVKLYKMIVDKPGLKAEGLHVYDGHIHDKEFTERKKKCDEAYSKVTHLIKEIMEMTGFQVRVVAGGTPTFPVHAQRIGIEKSPGTIILWDFGSASSFMDLDFLYAAVVLTRIISKPGKNLFCLDLGHKAIASEMEQPRIMIFGLDNFNIVGHNEEHMVISTPEASRFSVGDVLYGVPKHICPTVDRYDNAVVVKKHEASSLWNIEARKRKITI
jgi:D-serine deaminase-like pyridoxal phosphate-dependent protein